MSADWVKLIACDDCPPNQGVRIQCRDRELGVFHLTDPDRFAVIDNTCPHAGGSLAAGTITDAVVSCPWHHWQFNLNTGVSLHSSVARVRVYPCQVRDGYVFADLAGGTPSLEDYTPPGA